MPQTLIPCQLTSRHRCWRPEHTVYVAANGALVCVWGGAAGGYTAQLDSGRCTHADTVPRALAHLGYCLGTRQLEFEFNA